MLECIQCGHIQVSETTCTVCGNSMIGALDKVAAANELLNRLDHHGMRYTGEEREALIRACLQA